jgi:hypothetical protein
MNTVLFLTSVPCLSRQPFLPFRLQPSHVSAQAFLSFPLLFSLGPWPSPWSEGADHPPAGLGLGLKASPVARTLAQHVEPNRVHGAAPSQGHSVTDWLFTSGSSPRSPCCAAGAFGYRPVNLDLAGTSTPLCWRLRRRTRGQLQPAESVGCPQNWHARGPGGPRSGFAIRGSVQMRRRSHLGSYDLQR